MKKTHILIILVIAAAIGILVSTAGDASTYVGFGAAYEMATAGNKEDIHVVGELTKDASGNIIGIIRSKDAQTESTTYAVTSKTLLRLLRDVPRDKRPRLPVSNRLSRLSRQQQIEKLQDFTCMVQVYKK